MLTLNDGRSELWQWDTNRELTVDADCSQVHFSNKVFGRSIDVDVVDGVAIIPDILLQTDKELTAWAFVGTAENGYTKTSKVFKVNKRNKPADYVFTPSDQTTLQEIAERLENLENKTPETGFVKTVNGVAPDENGNVKFTIPEGGSGGIPIPETAEVGQTIVVKAVDENGKPTEWMPGGKWEELYSVTLTEEVDSIHIGLPEPAKRIYIKADGANTTSNTAEAAGKLRVGRNDAKYETGMSLARMFRKDHVQGFGARFEANGMGIFGFAKVSSGAAWCFIDQIASDINYIRIYGGIFGVGYKVTIFGEKEHRK
jgi:hypothetical protein